MCVWVGLMTLYVGLVSERVGLVSERVGLVCVWVGLVGVLSMGSLCSSGPYGHFRSWGRRLQVDSDEAIGPVSW